MSIFRRNDPIFYACGIALLLAGTLHYLRPEIGYARTVASWLYQPVCEIPPGRQFGVEYYGLIYTGNTTNLVDQAVLCVGAWEKHILNFLGQTTAALKQAKAAEADELVFVDVGANTGLHTLYMSQQVAQVHAFEPYPPVLAKLHYNVDHNALQNVAIHEVGLGDRAARLPFVAPPDANQGIGSFVTKVNPIGPAPSLELEIVVGDDYFPEHGIDRVDIMKIDVEGFEKPVLLGLRKTLDRFRPIIVFEIRIDSGSDGLFTSRKDVEAALPEDYALLSLAQWNAMTGFYQLGDLDVNFESGADQSDILAVPAELVDVLPRTGEASW